METNENFKKLNPGDKIYKVETWNRNFGESKVMQFYDIDECVVTKNYPQSDEHFFIKFRDSNGKEEILSSLPHTEMYNLNYRSGRFYANKEDILKHVQFLNGEVEYSINKEIKWLQETLDIIRTRMEKTKRLLGDENIQSVEKACDRILKDITIKIEVIYLNNGQELIS